MITLIKQAVPPARRSRVSGASTLRDVGLDSLTLMVVVSQFIERHPVPLEQLERLLPQIRTVNDLIDAGRTALESSAAASP